jgi:hypothetical protein
MLSCQVCGLYGNDYSRGSLLGLNWPCLVDTYQCFGGTWGPFLRDLLLRWKSAFIYFLLSVCEVIYVSGHVPLFVFAVLCIGKRIME